MFVSRTKYYVYIITNKEKTVLYTGITNDLEQRINEHYTGKNPHSFTSKDRCYYLIFYEGFDYINNTIAREKEIKGWWKEKKLQLIRAFNSKFDFFECRIVRWVTTKRAYIKVKGGEMPRASAWQTSATYN